MTRPRDLPYGESGLEFRWHERRWWCREAGCPRRSFTEQIPQIPAGARLTARLRGAAGRRIRDAEVASPRPFTLAFAVNGNFATLTSQPSSRACSSV
ncbi:hypothetical protein [Streptomyces sp. NPDC017964]|uniref:hypothetical protein n=1 Tax=Streptomyces sp. NPDC017964 TaxID=3365022 RepID=UPI00378EA27C